MGFDLAALVPVADSGYVERGPPRRSALHHDRAADSYRSWIAAGFHGEMAYLARPDALASRSRPEDLLPGLQSILVTGISYHTAPLSPTLLGDPSRAVIAGFARGDDYHEVVRDKLQRVARSVLHQADQGTGYRAGVDTIPILERALAAEAGLGFIGKNTCLINPRMGSWLFLGELLLTLGFPDDAWSSGGFSPSRGERLPSCGRCTRCIEACPTGALTSPYTMDARRCISYLTVELKGPVPHEMRPIIGNRVFGCDICQEVCPWNRRFARAAAEPAFAPGHHLTSPHLLDLMALDDAAFSRLFRGSPVKRAKRRGLLRNAAIALGNWGSPMATPALIGALHDPEVLVRGHAAWALGRIGTPSAMEALKAAHAQETNPWVQSEVARALTPDPY